MAEDHPPRRIGVFVIGAALGCVAGLLLAPKPGKETRKDVRHWLKQGRDKSRQLAAKLRKLPEKKDRLLAALRAGRESLSKASHNGHRRSIVHA